MGEKITEFKIVREIYRYGKDIIISEEAQQLKKYTQHGHTSVFEHAISVTKYSLIYAHLLERVFHKKIDYQSLVRGALLHDYFLYDWHTDHDHGLHGFTHPKTALKNAMKDFDLNPIEQDIIRKHMFPLVITPPKYIESAIICCADKWCATCETFKIDISSYIIDRVNRRYEVARIAQERAAAREARQTKTNL